MQNRAVCQIASPSVCHPERSEGTGAIAPGRNFLHITLSGLSPRFLRYAQDDKHSDWQKSKTDFRKKSGYTFFNVNMAPAKEIKKAAPGKEPLSSIVPGTGLEPVRPLRSQDFHTHFGFRRSPETSGDSWSGLSLRRIHFRR